MNRDSDQEPSTQSDGVKKGIIGLSIVGAIVAVISSNSYLFSSMFPEKNPPVRHSQMGPPPQVGQFFGERTQKLVLDLEGEWKFSTGDNLAWAAPEFDDAAWDTIEAPQRWEKSGYKDYDGFAWYRRTFEVDSLTPNKIIYLRLGRIDDVDETYLNGQLVGGSGSVEPYQTAWNWERLYALPTDLLKPNAENTIAIRVYDGEIEGGIVRGSLGIYTSTVPDPIIDLSGTWHFKTGDDMAWKNPEADASSFGEIYVPAAWEVQGHPHYDGTAWYRKSFTLSKPTTSEPHVFILGMIDDRDEAFLNGTRIGYTDQPEDAQSPYNIVRAYTFDPALLKDENVISVRVHDDGGIGGIYRGPVGIMTSSHYETFVEQTNAANAPSLRRTMDWLLGR